MAKSGPKLKVDKPKNVFVKPLTADIRALFKALAKGIGHVAVAKWEELGNDAIETLSAIGLETNPSELAFLLIRRSLTKALFDIVGECANSLANQPKGDEDGLVDEVNLALQFDDVSIDNRFLDRPGSLPLVSEVQSLLKYWLENHGISDSAAAAIASRFPSYFVYALNQEWRRNAKSYNPLLAALNTPFARAGEREWEWAAYSALLRRRIEESIFDEPFGLDQMFVPLNAYYVEDRAQKDLFQEQGLSPRNKRRIVVALQAELEQWLGHGSADDAIRVISGGPGSGKSSFARVFAARIAESGKLKVLFVPLHLIEPSKDLVSEIGRFVKDEGVLSHNPLDPDSPEPNLLIILDGLDELASQGKAAAETARGFIREVERTVERRNLNKATVRVLVSGREVVVQENESEFRRSRQILTLLPYFVADSERRAHEPDEYVDPKKLLKIDLRQEWWSKYGQLTGKDYAGLPSALNRRDLEEITAQPLLNYLVALSFTREMLDFSKDINLNAIYADLVEAVHERGYEKHRAYVPIRHMDLAQFSRVLEEIGLAAWHGDGRTTTVAEIEDHCRNSGVGRLLEAFSEGAKAGVTRLLAAFFFRQYGQRPGGDPTFVFTHKSFGEYLAARRIVRGIERIVSELDQRERDTDRGWDERGALTHWVNLCGPTSMSHYLFGFIFNELKLRSDTVNVEQCQDRLSSLFAYTLQYGLPMEQAQVTPFSAALFYSRNAEEALLAALNACARLTRRVSRVRWADPTLFGAWFRRIQGQRTEPISVLAASCLSYLDMNGLTLDICDFYDADFESSELNRVSSHYSIYAGSNLVDADLTGGIFDHSNFDGCNMRGARLDDGSFHHISALETNLSQAQRKSARRIRVRSPQPARRKVEVLKAGGPPGALIHKES